MIANRQLPTFLPQHRYPNRTRSDRHRFTGAHPDLEVLEDRLAPAGALESVLGEGFAALAAEPPLLLSVLEAGAAADFGVLTNGIPWSLDVDASGSAGPLTDGLLILRCLFGFTGQALVQDALDPAAQRIDPDDILVYIHSAMPSVLDVDLNGSCEPLSDGLLTLRYLFGFTGQPLVQDALDPAATRTSPEEIVSFLNAHTPGVGQTITVTLTSPAPGLLVKEGFEVTGRVDDNGSVASIAVFLDGISQGTVPLAPDRTFHVTLALVGSADGSHTLTFRATDPVGNTGAADLPFTLDTHGPQLTLSGLPSGMLVSSNIGLTGEVSDILAGVATLQVALDGQPPTDLTWDGLGHFSFQTTLPLDGSDDGPHQLAFITTDQLGNSALTEWVVTLTSPLPVGPVADLAAELGNQPVQMLEYVTNNIAYQPYAGSMKGAIATLETLEGNDWDQATLLVELLQQAGVPTRFAFGRVAVTAPVVQNWLGVTAATAATAVLDAAGLHPMASHNLQGEITAWEFDHTWVEAWVSPNGGAPQLVALDPSWKFRDYQEGISNILGLVPFDDQYFLSAWRQPGDPLYENAPTEIALGSAADYYEYAVSDYLARTYERVSIADVPHTGPIHPTLLNTLPVALPFTTVASATAAVVPAEWTHRVVVTLRQGAQVLLEHEVSLPEEGLLRLTISFAPGPGTSIIPELRLYGQVWATGPAVAAGSAVELVLTGYDPGDNTPDRMDTFARLAGQYLGLGFNAGQYSTTDLTRQQFNINEANFAAKNNEPFALDDQVGGLLSLAAATYFHDLNQNERRITDLTHAMAVYSHVISAVVTSDPAVVYDWTVPLNPAVPEHLFLDVGKGYHPDLAIDSDETQAFQRQLLLEFEGSVQEHMALEKLINAPTMSTIRSLQLAGMNQIPILEIDSSNAATLMPQLTLNPVIVSHVQAAVDSGATVTVPRDFPMYALNYRYDPDSGQMVPDPFDVSSVGYIVRYGTARADYIVDDGSITAGMGTVRGGDVAEGSYAIGDRSFAPCRVCSSGSIPVGSEVSIGTGTLTLAEADISIPTAGQPLEFTRYYDSLSDTDVGLGTGWTHSYSDYLDLTHLAIEHYLYWVTSRGVRYFVAWDSWSSSFFAPDLPGEFSHDGGQFLFRRNDGLTYTFNSSGQLTEIEDRYGNGFAIAYGTGSQIQSVIDLQAPANQLVFAYTDDHISQVTDPAGRAWSYEYVGTQLTQATSPGDRQTPAAVTQYDYYTDSARENLLASVTRPGGAQVFYAYYPNRKAFLVVDGTGLPQIFSYDQRTHKTLHVDQAGHATEYTFDRYGHSTKTTHPDRTGERSEWNARSYQETARIDAYGRRTEFLYDLTTHDLIISTDPAGGVTDYTYDTSFHQVTSITDPLGRKTLFTLDPSTGDVLTVTRGIEPRSAVETIVRDGDASTDDQVGQAVALDGDTLVIGAPGDDMAGVDAGAVRVLVRSGNDWVEQARLTANDAAAGDHFGTTLALEGDTLVIGAPRSDAYAGEAGAVYVFVRTGGMWAQQTRLGASDAAADDWFGQSVAVSGNTIVVGAPGVDNATIGVDAGAAYVFTWDGIVWVEEDQFSDAGAFGAGGAFGQSVAISGDTVVVGAPFSSDPMFGQGAASIFMRDSGAWVPGMRLQASDFTWGGDEFGSAVSLNGSTLVIGAPLSGGRGAAYVYSGAGAIWSQQARLTMGGPNAAGARFGAAVAVNGDTLVVGVPEDDVGGTNSGAAYLFARHGNLWLREQKLLPTGAGSLTLFGTAVAADLATITVGLPGDQDIGAVALYELTQEGTPIVADYTYTSRGRLDTVTDALGRTTHYDYDTLGRLVTVTEAVGAPEQASHTFEYDAVGNLVAGTDPNGNRTAFTYDVQDRLVSLTQPDPDGTGPLAAPEWSFTHDVSGNALSTTDPLGHAITFTYDQLNRLVQVSGLPQGTVSYTYDEVGNLVGVADASGRAIRTVFDAQNQPIYTFDPAGAVTRFTYDGNGNIASVADPVGNTTRFVYNALDRLAQEIDPRGQSIRYEYDPVGNVTALTDRNGRRTEYEYDVLDRLIRETWVGGDNVIHYTYDAVGNLTSVADLFSSLAITYDARDRVLSVDNAGTPGAPAVIVAYSYDPAGNVLSVADSLAGVGGALTAYTHDALNRVMQITHQGAGVAEKRVDLAYNSLGLNTAITRYADLAGTQLVAVTSSSYDPLGRLDSLTHTNGVVEVANYHFTYGMAGEITRLVTATDTIDYTYDSTGQLIGAAHSNPTLPDEAYEYDANGNRSSSSSHASYTVEVGNRLTSDGVYNYAYDNEGNLVRRTEISTGAYRELTWDQRNRLVGVTERAADGTATQVVAFTYDALNRRIGKAVDAVFTHFVHDRVDVILDFVDPDGPGPAEPVLAQRYLHGPAIDQIFAQENAAGEVYWHLTDHLGTVRDLVDNTGAVVNHWELDSFGNVLAQTASAPASRYLFTGREFDPATGLGYYRARYYDPATGRFLSEDPLRFGAGDLNLYRYVRNQVTSLVDPTGLEGQGCSNYQKLLDDAKKFATEKYKQAKEVTKETVKDARKYYDESKKDPQKSLIVNSLKDTAVNSYMNQQFTPTVSISLEQ